MIPGALDLAEGKGDVFGVGDVGLQEEGAAAQSVDGCGYFLGAGTFAAVVDGDVSSNFS
jgi:hypothetical protein